MASKKTLAKRQGKVATASNQQPQKTQSHLLASWEGPLPPPAILKGYDDLVPGAALRIIEMSEKEQEHRHKNEDEAVSAQSFSVKLVATSDFISRFFGILFLFFDFLATLYVGAYLGNTKLAAILFSPFVIVALIKAFSGAFKKK